MLSRKLLQVSHDNINCLINSPPPPSLPPFQDIAVNRLERRKTGSCPPVRPQWLDSLRFTSLNFIVVKLKLEPFIAIKPITDSFRLSETLKKQSRYLVCNRDEQARNFINSGHSCNSEYNLKLIQVHNPCGSVHGPGGGQ